MNKFCFLIAISTLFIFSCKKEVNSVDRSSDNLTHEDVVSLEKNSVFTNEALVYKGTFEGKYNGDKVTLKLANDKFTIDYKNETYKGDLFKKDDGSLMEINVEKHHLPFQFFRWSDNSEIMILNEDGLADDNGENYLTRTSE